ncbi:uncharacterized protein TNIN_449851 [Trichonephila inaurata madagascariensis]|uniref:Uncharacterized protein n=1 Tax=Trichonephila inaurata madagascariensis TaxID=2747483 RepID=A0A8X6YVT8_9ARAC|nr:uncharacterized protein TNIN_368691 [Trichonephila inaurata madagascariensis]GFY78729.1 uncharacterized protein TNIN_449851 [Trichonephila inaurata madagascariensis]
MKDSEIIKDTNVIDLFSYLMRNVKKGYEPYGFAVFWKGIKEIKILTRCIDNQKLVRNLEFDISVEKDQNKIDITSLEQEEKRRNEAEKENGKTIRISIL